MNIYRKKSYRRYIITVIGLAVAAVVFMYLFSFRAPGGFPKNSVVVIPSGKSLTSISKTLEADNVIRSPFWFENFIIFLKHEKGIVGGTYYFSQSMNAFQVAEVLSSGDFNMEQVKTTIPEGSTVFDISQILKKNYPDFDDIHFLTIAASKEGYLFPDTYVFGATPTPERVVTTMTATFNKKINTPDVQAAMKDSGRPLGDVIKMASILEGEARQMQTRKTVAGILWKRIDMGIPLQVDATFKYVNGKSTDNLTMNDLKIDSPYNTYVYKGLPPTPISNPGLDSILAALMPAKTDYMFFLTDAKGNMHYATTLDEHVANKEMYLK